MIVKKFAKNHKKGKKENEKKIVPQSHKTIGLLNYDFNPILTHYFANWIKEIVNSSCKDCYIGGQR